MLTPKQLEQCPDGMVELYAQLESDILADMARRIATYDYFIPSAQWQFKKQKELGNLSKDIIKVLSRATGKSEEGLRRLMSQAGAEALVADDEIYRTAGKEPPPVNQSKALLAVLNAAYKKTDKLFKNLTKTTAQTAAGQFEAALDSAHLQIMSGAFDQNTAIRNAVRNLSKQGIGAVKYPSGHTDTIEAAVRRATVTGVNQTCIQLQLARAEEMGCDLVETTAHGGARPEHAVWQGRVFSLSGKHDKYPDFYKSTGYGTGAGLGGWNCRHSFSPFFEGISNAAYSKSELKDYEAKKYRFNGVKMTEYEASQKQRYIERQKRRWKRENAAMAAAGLDTSESAAKIAKWSAIEKDFCRQTGLKRQAERSFIGGKTAGKGLNGAAKSGIIKENKAKLVDALVLDVDEKESKFTRREIIDEMSSSVIGKKTIENIENSNVLINIHNAEQYRAIRGEQLGNKIDIYLSNIKNIKVVAQTIIHEMTHYYYDIGNCQHAEAICFSMEKMHLLNRDYLTKGEWEQMVKLAVDNYSELEWEERGYGNFKQFDFVR